MDGVRDLLGFPREFVLHSLRHTFGAQLGQINTDIDAKIDRPQFDHRFAALRAQETVGRWAESPTPEIMENAILTQQRASQSFADETRPGLTANSTASESADTGVIH